jgi:hypothetical protein
MGFAMGSDLGQIPNAERRTQHQNAENRGNRSEHELVPARTLARETLDRWSIRHITAPPSA